MDGDPQGDRHGAPADDALSERLARLEDEVGVLRVQLAALVSQSAALPESTHPALASLSAVKAQRAIAAEDSSASMARPAHSERAAGPDFHPTALARRRPARQTLESQLGTRILSKVAVVLLLLGVAWFLKWAFDNRWIGPAGRVAAGLVAGVGVVLWSERFRRQQLAGFSYALKAVGSGVLYLSLWASVQLYHLAPAPVAFAAMVGVTAWNAVLAFSLDAQLLAGYALLGAYLTPLLLRPGGDHEIFLFSYLLVIASALLGLLRLKPWSLLLLGALAATAGIFIAWYVEFFDPSKAWRTAIFAVALWAVFAVAPLLAAETEGVIAGVLTPLSTGAFGALTIYSVLADSGGRQWESCCAVGFAAVYLVIARVMRARSIVAAVHLAVAVVFITVAIPLKATGRGILLSWLAEAVALIASSNLAGADGNAKTVLRALGCAALLLAVGGVLVQPLLFHDADQGLFNRNFGTALSAVAALAAILALATRMRERDAANIEASPSFASFAGSWFAGSRIAAGSLVLLNLVLLTAMRRELLLVVGTPESTQASTQGSAHPDPGAWGRTRSHADFAFSAWMMAQGAVMLAAGFWKRVALARWIGLVLLAGTVVKMFAYDMRYLGTGYRVVSYLGLGVLLMGVSFAYQKDWLGLLKADPGDDGTQENGEGKA